MYDSVGTGRTRRQPRTAALEPGGLMPRVGRGTPNRPGPGARQGGGACIALSPRSSAAGVNFCIRKGFALPERKNTRSGIEIQEHGGGNAESFRQLFGVRYRDAAPTVEDLRAHRLIDP